MLLAATKVEDFNRFMKIFSAAGAEKQTTRVERRPHLSRSGRNRSRLGRF